MWVKVSIIIIIIAIAITIISNNININIFALSCGGNVKLKPEFTLEEKQKKKNTKSQQCK